MPFVLSFLGFGRLGCVIGAIVVLYFEGRGMKVDLTNVSAGVNLQDLPIIFFDTDKLSGGTVIRNWQMKKKPTQSQIVASIQKQCNGLACGFLLRATVKIQR